MATPNEIAAQMVKTLSITEPDLDAGVGTPIRKVLDVVAEAIAEAYLDRYLLQYQYDIESKSGADLDAFVALFGFARLPAKRASGTILLQRSTPAPSSIFIPIGSQVATVDSPPVVCQTAAPATFPQGALTASVAVQAVVGGSDGNLSSNMLIRWMTPIEGIVAVTNPAPLTGGSDAESDDQLKERFRRSIFRNLAGTEDMYLGIALNDENVTNATVIGPTERWREQIQIVGGTATSTITSPTVPSFALNNASNATPIAIGTAAAHPFVPGDVVTISGVGGNLAANGTFRVKAVSSTTSFTISKLDGTGDTTGSGAYTASTGSVKLCDRAKWIYDTGYAFGSNIDAGAVLTPGVHYTLNTTTIPPTVTSIDPINCPDGIYDLTFNYCPACSRNDPALGITNRVDIYTDGARPKVASETVILDSRIVIGAIGSGGSRIIYQWRRSDGQMPSAGNYLVRLSFAPVIDLPNTLAAIGLTNPVEGVDYWMLNEVGTNFQAYNSLAAIEFSGSVYSFQRSIGSSTNANPTVVTVSGHNFSVGQRVIIENHATNTAANGVHTITATTTNTITLDVAGNGVGGATGTVALFHPVSPGYTYNAIPRDVQSKAEAWRLIGADMVVHHGNQFNIKTFAAVILKPGYTIASIQSAVNSAVSDYLTGLKFGGILQVSDLLNVIGDVTGIDAVRLLNSSDVTGALTVTSSAGTPIQVTTSTNHGLAVGDLVQIDGVLGNTNTNGNWVVQQIVNATNFTLKNSATNAAYTSGGTVIRSNFAIQRVEDNGVAGRQGYVSTPTVSGTHRAVDVYALDNEYFVLSSIVLTAKAANTFGVV